jgi:hypothetical protein
MMAMGVVMEETQALHTHGFTKTILRMRLVHLIKLWGIRQVYLAPVKLSAKIVHHKKVAGLKNELKSILLKSTVIFLANMP